MQTSHHALLIDEQGPLRDIYTSFAALHARCIWTVRPAKSHLTYSMEKLRSCPEDYAYRSTSTNVCIPFERVYKERNKKRKNKEKKNKKDIMDILLFLFITRSCSTKYFSNTVYILVHGICC